MKVIIPSILYSYTNDIAEVQATGASLAAVIDNLETQYTGIRFRIIDEQDRIRPHIRIFVNQSLIKNIDTPLGATDEVLIIGALSGG